MHLDKKNGTPEHKRRVTRVNSMNNGVVRFRGPAGTAHHKARSIQEVDKLFTPEDHAAWHARDWRKKPGVGGAAGSQDANVEAMDTM